MNMFLMNFVPGENPAITAAREERSVGRRLIVSIIFTVPLLYLSLGHLLGAPLPPFFDGTAGAIPYAFTQLLLVIPVVIANRAIFSSGFRSLIHRSPNMDALVALGAASAIGYGIFAIYQIGFALGVDDRTLALNALRDVFFDSAAMILTLITVGKYFEARARGRTTSSLSALYALTPKNATRIVNGKQQTVPVSEIGVGDRLLVKAGESVPVDGVVVSGTATIDESAITGESKPVTKVVGDPVTGATVATDGSFEMKATRVGADTTIAGIIKLVDEAQLSQAPIQRLADRISAIVIPIVIGVAIVTLIIWLLIGAGVAYALTRAISVLIITCPCALGLATPTAIMVATGRASREGILIKTGGALEVAGRVKTVVLDKTGTITIGKPQVNIVVTADGVSKSELLAAVWSLEALSDHPLAKAIVAYASNDGPSKNPQAEGTKKSSDKDGATAAPPLAMDDLKTVPGGGLVATCDGKTYRAGNAKLMADASIDVAALTTSLGDAAANSTCVYVSCDEKPLGAMALADAPRPTSAAAIAKLKSMGIHTIMLSGDTEQAAKAIADQVGIDQVIAGVLPAGKEREIAKLQAQGGPVAMVGDGTNDAPALAKADVGIAVGAGTDIAIQSADIVITSNDLIDVAAAIDLSKATLKNIRENLRWALVYNIIAIPLAAGVLASVHVTIDPMISAAAMAASSVGVVLNSLRLRRWMKPGETSLPKLRIPDQNRKDAAAAIKASLKKPAMAMPGMAGMSMGGMSKGGKAMGGMDMGGMTKGAMDGMDMSGASKGSMAMGGMDMSSQSKTGMAMDGMKMGSDTSMGSMDMGKKPMATMKMDDDGSMAGMTMSSMTKDDDKKASASSSGTMTMDDQAMGSMTMDGPSPSTADEPMNSMDKGGGDTGG